MAQAAPEPRPYSPTAATLTDAEIASLALFQSVDVAQLGPVLRNCEIRTLAAGEVLIRAGRPNDHLHAVLSGKLSVHLAAAESAPITEIGAGECVGELSVVDRRPTSAYVIAKTPCRVLSIDEPLLWTLVNSSHSIAGNLLYGLTRRLRSGNQLLFENRERLERYQYHATVDALTGLFNRHWLNTMLPRQMHRSRKCGDPFSLAMLDIDHFKRYNDEHGHVAGDCAIAAVAQTLLATLRPTDMAARYGGEEFLVLLPNCTVDGAAGVAERLRAGIEQAPIHLAHGPRLPSVTASIGVQQMPDEGPLASLLIAVDEALYRAKESGRNRVSA